MPCFVLADNQRAFFAQRDRDDLGGFVGNQGSGSGNKLICLRKRVTDQILQLASVRFDQKSTFIKRRLQRLSRRIEHNARFFRGRYVDNPHVSRVG